MATNDPGASTSVSPASLSGQTIAVKTTQLSQGTGTVRRTATVILPSTTTMVDEEDLRLSKQFDVEVPDRATLIERVQDGVFKTGQRILVRHDERLNGFWTIWAYAPKLETADANGLVFEDVQSYRTSDFFDVVDWYAEGYDPLFPPAQVYATAESRNIGEGPNPTNTLVKVLDDGGKWAWFHYEDGSWVLVARQTSTVRFKETFFDQNRDVYSVDTRDARQIATRDGSWELREIFNALRTRVLSPAQLNELFFSMLHFIHAQQDEVNWTFKTSFLSIVGYNERLSQTPIQAYDTTQNLLDYVDEVKPYRVKTREFKRVLSPDLDLANTHVTDFDKPLYYDARLNRYRRLNPASAIDMEIMKVTSPWSDWYENRNKTDHDNPASANWNPIRNFRITLLFDRCDPTIIPLNSGGGWDIPPWDVLGWDGDESNDATGGSALARVLAYYQPTVGMVGVFPEELMDGLGFRGVTTEGKHLLVFPDDVSEWDVRPYDTEGSNILISKELDNTVDGYQGRKVEVVMNDDSDAYGLRDPYREKGHPEELIPVEGNESVTMIAHTEWSVGAPNQYVTHVATKRIRRSTLSIPFHGLASSTQAVVVHADGLRMTEGTDYTVSIATGSVLVTLPLTRPTYVTVHAFGVAGQDRIVERVAGLGDGTNRVFELARNATGSVEVIVDGQVVGPSNYAVSGRSVTFLEAPAQSAFVLLVTYDSDRRTALSTHVSTDTLPYVESQKWTLTNRTEIGSPVEHMGTIVEVDGKRLMPPVTQKNLVIAARQFLQFQTVNDLSKLKLYVDDNPYQGRIYTIDPAILDPQDDALPVGIYVADKELFVNDPSVRGKVLLSVMYDDHDYQINDGVLAINPVLDPESRVVVTTFQNANRMGIETYTFPGNAEGYYRVPIRLISSEFAFVSLNGKTLVCGEEFDLTRYKEIGWDIPDFDKLEWGGEKLAFLNISALTIPGGQTPKDRIVVTVFKGRPADEPSTWAMMSAKPSLSMMGDAKLTLDWGISPFDTTPIESAIPFSVNTPQGPRNVYRMNDSWETFAWETDERGATRPRQGVLVNDLGPDDASFTVATPTFAKDTGAFYSEPKVDSAEPGVVWINGERIEYFQMSYDNSLYTFSELRRTSRGSRQTTEGRRSAIFDSVGLTYTLKGGTMDTTPEVRAIHADGTHTDLQAGPHFTVAATDTGLNVTLLGIPTGAVKISIGQSFKPVHRAGTLVRDVTQTIYLRDCPFRINEDITELALTTAGYAA